MSYADMGKSREAIYLGGLLRDLVGRRRRRWRLGLLTVALEETGDARAQPAASLGRDGLVLGLLDGTAEVLVETRSAGRLQGSRRSKNARDGRGSLGGFGGGDRGGLGLLDGDGLDGGLRAEDDGGDSDGLLGLSGDGGASEEASANGSADA